MIRSPARWVSVATAAILLTACSGDDGNDGFNSLVSTRTIDVGDAVCPGGGLALDSGLDLNRNSILDPDEVIDTSLLECEVPPQLRALHASPDAPPVNILVNGTPALTDVDYTEGSGFVVLDDEPTQVQVEAIIPDGNAIVIDETLDLEDGTEYSVVAVGKVGDPVIALVVAEPYEPVGDGNIRAQVLHAAPAAPAVDVFVTAPDADLGVSTPINPAPLAYQDSTDRVEVPAGTYQVRVTVAGDPTTVVFDSGPLDLAAGADLLAVAVENTATGTAPIQLALLDGETASLVLDVNTPAAVVAVHDSPDAPAVDVLADVTATPGDEGILLAGNVSFPAFCEIAAVPAPGEYTISVTVAGDPDTVALQFPLAVEPSDQLTAIVTGFLAGTPAIQPLALVNDTRSIATEARLRVVHGSPSTGNVDLYLVADGTDITDPAVNPTFADVPFTADTGIQSIATGIYDVYVTPAGNNAIIAIEVQDLALNGGEVLDVIARDPATDGSEGTLPQLIVIEYANLPVCTT